MFLTRKDWILKNAPIAIEATQGTGIFPETLLAQAVVESQGNVNGSWYPGAGLVARKAQNYFGIKKGTGWNGPTINLPTPGDADKISTFRVYSNFQESVKDYIKFLQINPRYKRAGVFDAPDYIDQIIAISKAGYAESSSYRDVLTKVATSIKKQISNIIEPIKKNGAIAPILIAGLVITFFFIAKKYKHD